MFEGRAAIGYDHGYDTQRFYLGLALDLNNVKGIVEGCLERIGEDDPDGEMVLRAGRGDLFFDVRPQQNVVLNEGRIEEFVVEVLTPLACPFQAHTQIRVIR